MVGFGLFCLESLLSLWVLQVRICELIVVFSNSLPVTRFYYCFIAYSHFLIPDFVCCRKSICILEGTSDSIPEILGLCHLEKDARRSYVGQCNSFQFRGGRFRLYVSVGLGYIDIFF